MSRIVPPILSVAPIRALVDETFKVLVDKLSPGSPVTVRALHHSEDQDYWEAYGHYISDPQGRVSVSDDMSFGGTYTGKEAMGLLWSMRPVPGSRTGLRLRKINVSTPMLVQISVYRGHDFRDQTPLASVLTERWHMAPGVQRIDINEDGVLGTLFIPPGPGPFPGLMDMWGGGGGLLEYRSALLASHGFACLALEYFKPGELMTADLEFKYFEKAFNIVKDHPKVMPDRVGLFGLSLGSSVSMYLATESKVVEPRCCVCVNGNHSFGRSISEGHAQMHKTFNKAREDENNFQVWRDISLQLLKDASLKFDMGKVKCPLMLVSGADDQNCPSVEVAEDISQMMHAAGNEHLLTRLDYPDTGHLIEPPFSPHFRASNFIVYGRGGKRILLWGGQTKPHSDAQEDSWRKILTFLRMHLCGDASPKAKL